MSVLCCVSEALCSAQVWEKYEPAAEAATTSGADEQLNGHASSNSPRETMAVTVTEVVSGSEFYVQVRIPLLMPAGVTTADLVCIWEASPVLLCFATQHLLLVAMQSMYTVKPSWP